MVRLTLKEFLDNNKITRYELSKRSQIDYQTIDKYYKNNVLRYDSYILDKICTALDCEISDMIEFKK